MLNSVSLQGRFTADVELKMSQNGKAYCKFTLACDRDFTDQNGNRSADFINCMAWGKTAEFIAKYFGKGKMAAVIGRIETRSWQTDDGQKRYATEVNVTSCYFCGSRDDSGGGPRTTQAAPTQTATQAPQGFTPVETDELPF